MALSMTGFGRGSYTDQSMAIGVELRSVNHRFLDISMHLPRSLSRFEDRLRRSISERLHRGRVDAFISLESVGPGAMNVILNQALVEGYHGALMDLADRYGLARRLRLDHFLRLPDLFLVEQADFEEQVLWEGLISAVSDALDELTSMRRTEGDKLAGDIIARASRLERLTRSINERAPSVAENYHHQLEARLAELGQTGLDENRLAQEVAFFTDRCSITEELVRLQSHYDQLRRTLAINGPLGRKLDFILQEINREINTVGAKANDLEIAQAVIEVKTELEKIREQTQNLE